jgi:hypothetical protein
MFCVVDDFSTEFIRAVQAGEIQPRLQVMPFDVNKV